MSAETFSRAPWLRPRETGSDCPEPTTGSQNYLSLEQRAETVTGAGGRAARADTHEALQLSAALWACEFLFAAIHNFTLGRFRTPVEITAVCFATLTAVCVASLAYKAFTRVPANSGSRTPFFLAIILLATLLQTALEKLIGLSMIEGIYLNPVTLGFSFFIYFFLYSLNLAIFQIVTANRRVRSQALRLVEAEAERLRAELQTLRLKLNPHFLFNALSAASALVAVGRQAEGEAMMNRLANFLRSTFEMDVGDISLSDELSLLEDYLDVERTRFQDRLLVEMSCVPEVADALVPSLLLQPLVENAVKYAVSTSVEPVTITVRAWREDQDLMLAVEDDGSSHPASLSPGTGLGQAATRSRLLMRYGARAEFEAGPEVGKGYRVTMRLPLIYPDAAPASSETASLSAV
jgi:sensor histidine kinase YesM